MCDTMGMIVKAGTFFGKNSDRQPQEPQVTEWRPAATHTEAKVKCTYIEVDQAKYTHGTLLSRPTWLWGAEIGVNDQGVVIGNEALFTTNQYADTGLTGMDLLRMGLERSETAQGAMETIIELLEQYGQGGNCGYQSELFYDNAFLIMDRKSLYVLETVGKQWAYKKLEKAAISNCISLGDDADAYSGERVDFHSFAHPEQEPMFGGRERRALSQAALANGGDIATIFKALRNHREGFTLPVTEKCSCNVCLHAGPSEGSQSTASLAADLQEKQTIVYVTGGALPCLSLYKPYVLDEYSASLEAYSLFDQAAWETHDRWVAKMAQAQPPAEFYAERDALEQSWHKQVPSLCGKDSKAFLQACIEEEKRFYEKWTK